MKMKSLLSRLTLALCLTAVALLTAGGLVVYFVAQRLLEANFDDVLGAKADALLTTAEVENGRLEIDFEVQAFAGFGSAAGGDYYEFRTPEGVLLGRSPSLKRDRLSPPMETPQRRPRGSYTILPDGREGRVLWQATPLEAKDGAPDLLVELGVASDSGTLRQTLGTLAGVLIITSGAGLLLTLLVLRGVLRRGLRPVDTMAREVHEIDVENAGDRLHGENLPEELKPVGRKVNELLDRARRSMDRERSFSSHAAHELRTPLAELRAMTDLMTLWQDEATPERFEEMQQVIIRLEGLLQKLSLLAKADAGQQKINRESVPLEASLEGAVQRFADEAARKNLQITLTARAGFLTTDPLLWEAIVNNLLENAITYAPPRTTIEVKASAEGLIVSNTAPQLTPADLDRLTDRFWRKDSKAASENGSHSGLGLALVTSYVRLLGGTCDFQLAPDQTFTVALRWMERSQPTSREPRKSPPELVG